jgi:hypothetical protein
VLKQYIVADGVDEGPEALGLAQRIFPPQCGEHSGESLLTHVLDGLGGLKARPEFQMKKLGKIAYEVFLGRQVPCTEVFDVTCIECTKLQSRLRQLERTQV